MLWYPDAIQLDKVVCEGAEILIVLAQLLFRSDQRVCVVGNELVEGRNSVQMLR